LLVFLYIKKTEGFVDAPVPDACKKAGFNVPLGLLKILGEEKLASVRLYTEKECNQLDGGVYHNGSCYQLKDNTKNNGNYNLNKDNIIMNYSDICSGLNKTPTLDVIDDCKINGKALGKPNKAFVVTTKDDNGKDVKWNYEDNFFQSYSQNECQQLKGQWYSIETFMKDNKKISDDEIKSYIAINGKDTGICTGPISYSVACVQTAPPTTSSKVSDALKDGVKDWLS